MHSARIGLAAVALVPAVGRAQTYDEHRLIAIARDAVVSEVRGEAAHRPQGGSQARPVFVTIEVDGKIRGCRGDLATRARSLEDEVALAARSAAAHDPRYRPLSPNELKKFLVTVTIVDRTDVLASVSSLTPEDGLVLKGSGRTGIVLPWEGKDPETRLQWAYRKAGVARGSAVALLRLVAQRFRG